MIYVDTSFLVSLYSTDANSAIALEVMQASGPSFVTSTLGELEVVNAIGLRVFRKEITPAQMQASLGAFEQDLHNGIFRLRPLAEVMFERALRLSRQTTPKLGVRTADVLHVAAALELGATHFYSFDQRQRNVARIVKLNLN